MEGNVVYSVSIQLQNPAKAGRIPEFVQLACRFESHLSVRSASAEFNAKSIMGMLSLDMRDGHLVISGEGSDEQEAVNALASFFTE